MMNRLINGIYNKVKYIINEYIYCSIDNIHSEYIDNEGNESNKSNESNEPNVSNVSNDVLK